MTIEQVFAALIGPAGALFVLGAALIGAVRGWWVPGKAYREMEKHYQERIFQLQDDRDKWIQLALSGTSLAEKAMNLIQKK